jgi:hypothetical protein
LAHREGLVAVDDERVAIGVMSREDSDAPARLVERDSWSSATTNRFNSREA